MAPVLTVLQLECVVGEQTGLIMSRVVAGQAWGCSGEASAIGAMRSRINAMGLTAIMIRDIAFVPAVVAVVDRQFSSMCQAGSR